VERSKIIESQILADRKKIINCNCDNCYSGKNELANALIDALDDVEDLKTKLK